MAFAPGASLAPFGDSFDAVILTLTDSLTIAGEVVKARTALYRPADEKHSIKTAGDEPAQYISFE